MPPETTVRRRARGPIEALFGRGALPPPEFSWSFSTPSLDGDGADPWQVRRFELHERVGEPYRADVQLLAPGSLEQPDLLLGARVELLISRGDAEQRVVGVVTRSSYHGSVAKGQRVDVTVEPSLALLRNERRSRVFQDNTVLEIVELVAGPVLERFGGALDRGELVRSYPSRDYRVQYRETDLGFLLRLLAEEGIALLFRHDADGEVAVLVDTLSGLPSAGAGAGSGETTGVESTLLPRWQGDPATITHESVATVGQVHTVARAGWSAAAWDWKSQPPRQIEEARERTSAVSTFGAWREVEEQRPGEGLLTDGPIEDETARRTALLVARDDGAAVELRGESNATVLRAGCVFELVDQRRDVFDQRWIVEEIVHVGDAPHVGLRGGGESPAASYSNTFRCVSGSTMVRARRRPRPRAFGLATAIVTGPESDAVHTDPHGRIRVRFQWDSSGAPHRESSCWLRVAQPWAGDGYGMTFLPRVGAEVAVSFVDGDPDRPVCTGSLHNGAAPPTYALPENRTRTVLRTRHEGDESDGHHELYFEDGAGIREVSLHAGGNLRERVTRSHSTNVSGSRDLCVGGKRSVSIGKDDQTTIEGQQELTVHGDSRWNVHSGLDLRVSEKPGECGTKGMRTVVDAGRYEVEAKDGIELRCGKCRITITPDSITLAGPRIEAVATEGGGQLAPTLLLEGLSASLSSDVVVAESAGASLCLDESLAATQGGGSSAGAELQLQGGNVDLKAANTTSIGGDAVGVRAKRDALLGGHDVVVSSEGTLVATSQDGTNITSTKKMTLKGALIAIN